MTASPPNVAATSTPMPRGLVFAASGWVAASWLVVIGVKPPLQPTSSAYTPAAEMMLLCMLIGGFVAWPLFRLTVAPRHSIPVRTCLEIIALVGMIQIVVWPLRLVTTWTISRVVWVDIEIICTLLLLGGLVIRVAGSRMLRTATMALILIWLILPPTLGFLLGTPDGIGLLSPLARIWHLARGGAGPIADDVWVGPGISLLIAIALWAPSMRSGLAEARNSQ